MGTHALFNVSDKYQFELINSVKHKFQCSQATIYRALKRANMPVYYLPRKSQQTLLYSYDLWKFACCQCFKKFLKKQGIKLLGKWKLWHIKQDFEQSDVITLFNEGYFAPLTFQEVIAAIHAGLVPANLEDLSLPTFFIARLKNLIVLPLPRKA